jgi:hypothetical protein
MSRPPIQSVGKIARAAGMSTAAGGSAGLLADLPAASKSTVTVIALTVIIVSAMIISSLPKIVDSIYQRRPAILKMKILREETGILRKIAVAGLDPEKTESALKILRQIAINPALPKDQRLSDETYRELLKPETPAGEGCPPDPHSA